ncbi:Sushi domain (SCR repeat) family protein [Brugia pahangi]
MVLKLSILVIVVLSTCGMRTFTTAEYHLVRCPRLTYAENSYVGYNMKNGKIRGIGSTAYMKCHLYHNLYGNNVTTCSFDGIWRPKLGVCKLKPKYDENFCKPYGSDRQPLLKYSTSLKTRRGTLIIIKCQPGQRLYGSAISKCTGGVWKPILGICADNKTRTG